MEYPVIASRLLDIPPAFTRPDTNYAAMQAAFALALANYCLPADSVVTQTYFSLASGGWLNVWGQLLGFPRYPSEADSSYRSRVMVSLAAPVGSPLAVQTFATYYFNSPCIVTENPPGYTIQIPSFATTGQVCGFCVALGRIRPVGVPCNVVQTYQSFYLNTFNYISGSGIAGPYFGGLTSGLPWLLAANTNNSQPLLPSLILTDPILNGQVTL